MNEDEQYGTLSELTIIWHLQSERERGVLSFREAVYEVVKLIPQGSVLGYGQVASLLGSPRAARQVGYALGALPPHRTHPDSEECVPWWRVLRTNGHIALKGDSERPELQKLLLRQEGLIIIDYRVDMNSHTWIPSEDKIL